MTVYDSYTILNPTPGKYEADHPLVIGVNQSRVKTTINVPEIFAAGRYYFRGVNTVISGVVASDAGKPAYIEANLQDGEIGAGTLMLLSVHGVEANFPYSIKHVPLFETEVDASEIDTSGLVTKDTFNSTVARIDSDIQKGDTDLRLDLDALTSRFTQLSSEVNAELDTFDESLGRVETEVKNLADEVETAEVTANTAKTTADEAKTNADDAVQRAINARLEANKANDAVKRVQTDLDKLEETVSTGSSDLTAITDRVTTAEGKITTLEGKVTTAESDISAVETTTAHLTDNLNQLTTSVTETKGVVDGLEVKVIDLRAEVDTLKTRTETADNDISGLQTSVSNVGAIATKAQNDATQALDDAANAMADAAAAQSTANEAKNAIKNLAPSYSLKGPKTQTLDSSYRAVLEGVDLTSSYWLEVVAGATNQLFSALTVIITSNNTLNTRIILDGSIKGDAGNLMFTAAILPMFGLVDIQPIDDKNFASSRDGRPPSGTSRIGKITVIAKGTEVAGATIRLYKIVTNYGG